MHKVLVGSLVTAGLVAGSLGVVALNPLGVATAAVSGDSQTQSTDPSTTPGTDPSTTQGTDPATTPPSTDPSAPAPSDHKGPLGEVLDELVKNGTLTQAQADAVQAGVDAKRPAGGHGFGRGGHFGAGRELFTDLATQLGMDPQALATELRSGKSIADVAGEKGIDPQTIIDHLVSAANAKIDQAVTDGKLDQAKADEIKAKTPERIKALVEHKGGGLGGGKFHGPGPGATPDQPSN